MIKTEICVNSDNFISQSVSSAYIGGADTIELCSQMHLSGLTPGKKEIIKARKAFEDRSGLMVMIRNRAGNFNYTKIEISEMCNQIKLAAECKANGVVFGTLSENNNVDIDSLKRCVDISKSLDLLVTFHRAFDATPNPLETLKILIENGVDRILTSGTKWNENKSAVDGVDILNKIINSAENKIEVVIGGGIAQNNVVKILEKLLNKSNKISFHAYSSVLVNGAANLALVKSFVETVKNYK